VAFLRWARPKLCAPSLCDVHGGVVLVVGVYWRSLAACMYGNVIVFSALATQQQLILTFSSQGIREQHLHQMHSKTHFEFKCASFVSSDYI